MDFQVIDIDNISEVELIQVISSNIKTSRLMSSEIEKMRKATTISNKDSCEIEDEFEDDVLLDEEDTYDVSFEDECDYYYQLISGCTMEDLENNFMRLLPSRENYNYKRILIRMKAEIIKLIKEIKDFIGEEELTGEDLEVFSDELKRYRKILDLLDIYLQDDVTLGEESIENKLVFFTTPSLNIHVFDSLEGIDSEYYERFRELFLSIKNGTFKGVKRFNNHNTLNGLCEVKGYQVRVIYARLSYDTYAIISAFVKKADNDQSYKNFLVKHCRDYNNVEKLLKESIKNPEFMEQNALYEEELFRLLDPKGEKVSPFVKEKGDN